MYKNSGAAIAAFINFDESLINASFAWNRSREGWDYLREIHIKYRHYLASVTRNQNEPIF